MTEAAGRVVVLAAEDDVGGFRREARRLLNEGIEPAAVQWHVANAVEGDLFADATDPVTSGAAAVSDAAAARAGSAGTQQIEPVDTTPRVPVPAFFLSLCERALLHADPGRFGLLYRLLWRLVHEPGLRHDPLDADRMQAEQMARAVRRDMHKMTAFVRFRPVGDRIGDDPAVDANADANADADIDFKADADIEVGAEAGSGTDGDASADGDVEAQAFVNGDAGYEAVAELDARTLADADADAADDAEVIRHVAWFEPGHHIVRATAPFFARRFAQMRWAILTPEACVRWDGRRLEFGPGARRDEAPRADAAEQLWLTYYASIFNPARLKLKMMQKEMPRRYWKNLPEAVLIQPLAAAAAERSGRMVEQGASEPLRRRPAASTALRLDRRGAVAAASASTAAVGAATSDMSDAAPELPGIDMTRTSSSSSLGATLIAIVPATSLEELKSGTEACRACPIGALATQSVPGVGPPDARLMLVGEQPGDQEDLRGAPFVGPAGQLLDRGLRQLGWPRDTLYLTNAVKHFKYELRGKRRIHKSPAQQEISACLHWLENEIGLVRPAAAVALGATAARALMGRPVAVTRERGQWLTRSDGLRVLITLHPSALLRMDPADQQTAFARWLEDLTLADEFVDGKANS